MTITFPMLLGLVFVILKLCGVIAWSWWWVTCPFWVGLAIVLVVVSGGVMLSGICLGVAMLWDKIMGR